MRGTLQYSLLCWGLLALSSQDDVAPLPFRFFLNNPFLQALGLVEEKPGKQEHRHQHKGAQHHQPHVAAVGERGPGWLLCRDHVGQVQHVAQGPACITAANLKHKSRISAVRLPEALPEQWHPWGRLQRTAGVEPSPPQNTPFQGSGSFASHFQ